MKKKTLSLALALAVCLGLTVPAFAAEAGDTTIVDANGIAYKLSNPIVGTEPLEEYMIASETEGEPIVYLVPLGTNIMPVVPEGFTVVDDDGSLKFEQGDHYMSFLNGVGWYSEGGYGGMEMDGTTIENKGYLLIQSRYFKGSWDDCVDSSLYFKGVEGPSQPEDPTDPAPTDPGDPAYQVSGWAKDRVALAVEAGLAPEGLGSDYRVDITRAQFAAVSVKLYEAMSGGKAPAVSENPFTDTEDPVILQAADLGFVSGVGGGKLDPDALVNREQAAVMLASVYTKLGGEIPAVEATTFGDDGEISGWARNAVAFMNSKEIVTGIGDNNFGPKGGASIEQALLISLKMFETLK